MNTTQLNEARAAAWHQDGQPLLTADAAGAWLRETGLCLWTPRPQQLAAAAPSLVEATLGAANPTPSLAEIRSASELLYRLLAAGDAVALNLLGTPGEQPDVLATPESLPFVFALRGDREWKRGPRGKSSPLQVETWKLLGSDGPLTAAEIKDRLGRQISESAALRALVELWSHLRVEPLYGTPDEPARWQLLERAHESEMAAGAKLSQAGALSGLVSLYLQSAIAASEAEIETFLSPIASRSKLREVVRGLTAARQLGSLHVGPVEMFHLEGGLPEFAETPAAEGAVVVGEEGEGLGEEAAQPKPRRVSPSGVRPAAGAAEPARKPYGRRTSSFNALEPWKENARPGGSETGERRPLRPRGDDARADAGGGAKSGSSGERRAFRPRENAGGEAPRRSFKPRENAGGEAPRRSFKPRENDGGEAPRRSFKPRENDGGEAPRRSFNPREEAGSAGRPPFRGKSGASTGDRKSFPGSRAAAAPGGKRPFRRDEGGAAPSRPERFAGSRDRDAAAGARPFRPKRDGGDARPAARRASPGEPSSREARGGSYGPRKPFGARPGSGGARPPFAGKRPAAGDARPPFAGKRPAFGAPRPPAGERRPFRPDEGEGERPSRPRGEGLDIQPVARPAEGSFERPKRFGGRPREEDRRPSGGRPRGDRSETRRPVGGDAYEARRPFRPAGEGGRRPFPARDRGTGEQRAENRPAGPKRSFGGPKAGPRTGSGPRPSAGAEAGARPKFGGKPGAKFGAKPGAKFGGKPGAKFGAKPGAKFGARTGPKSGPNAPSRGGAGRTSRPPSRGGAPKKGPRR